MKKNPKDYWDLLTVRTNYLKVKQNAYNQMISSRFVFIEPDQKSVLYSTKIARFA